MQIVRWAVKFVDMSGGLTLLLVTRKLQETIHRPAGIEKNTKK